MHAMFPEMSETLESLRQAWHFKRLIKRSGYQMPLPAFIKRSIIKRHLLDNNLQTLVETGTQYGDTPWLFRNELAEIWSIELSPMLAKLARKRFRRYPHIHIVQGDSSDCLSEIVKKLGNPVLFWLDGHYSAGITARGSLDCPIYKELSCIFTQCKQPYIVLIDDARSFGTDKDYPTLAELGSFVRETSKDADLKVDNDIIFIRSSAFLSS
jgi:hypothetical protein